MERLIVILREVIVDIVKLNLPVTAAAAVATVVSVVAGLGPVAPVITGILVAIGVVAETLKRLLGLPTVR